MQKFRFIIAVFFAIFFVTIHAKPLYASFRPIDENKCPVAKQTSDQILRAVIDKDPNVIGSLSNCIKHNHRLVFQACLIDPSQLQNADNIFRNDENFVARLVKVNPEILKYIADDLKNDGNFFENMSYLNRDALKYAGPKLLNSKPFMEKMIHADSRNYMYASNRIKEIPAMIESAFKDDGLLLAHAPDSVKGNRKFVKIAVKSNIDAINFAADNLKNDIELKLIIGLKPELPRLSTLENFLSRNYITEEKDRNIGLIVDKKTKFAKKNRLVNRDYITKWQRLSQFNGYVFRENLHLLTAENRNNPVRFAQDLKKYPDLVKKIKKFFLQRHIDESTIDDLSLTYLWKIKDKPLTLAFNLYLLRDSNDSELGAQYASITSLTAIAQKTDKEWHFSVLQAIFDSETRMDPTYEDGHKKYILQDLYFANKRDKNPQLIFRVEDKFIEYFEIFSEQKGGKYKLLYRIDPLKNKDDNGDFSDLDFGHIF